MAQETRDGGVSAVALALKKKKINCKTNESRILTLTKISSGQLGSCSIHSIRHTSAQCPHLCALLTYAYTMQTYSRLIGYKINLIVKCRLTGRNKQKKISNEDMSFYIINLSFFLMASTHTVWLFESKIPLFCSSCHLE